jgi:hypothetical protein
VCPTPKVSHHHLARPHLSSQHLTTLGRLQVSLCLRYTQIRAGICVPSEEPFTSLGLVPWLDYNLISLWQKVIPPGLVS